MNLSFSCVFVVVVYTALCGWRSMLTHFLFFYRFMRGHTRVTARSSVTTRPAARLLPRAMG